MVAIGTVLDSGASTEDTVDVQIKIGGTKLDGEAAAQLIDLTVASSVGEAAQLTLRVAAWDSDSEELKWVDDALFAPGGAIDVEIGYLDKRVAIFHGDIAGLTLEAGPTARAVLTVTAYDVLHRLGRGQRSDIYRKKSYAGIVRHIAQHIHHLEVDAPDDSARDPEYAVVNQRNESDLQFILKLAGEIGYELVAEGSKVVFRPSHAGESAQLTLDAGRDLVQFTAHLSAASQLSGVDVISLNSETKEVIKVGEDNPGNADERYSASGTRAVIVDDPLATEAQAKARAKAELARMRETYLEATGTCLGRMDLKAGMIVQIDNLGSRFGGAYYVSSVTHSVSAAAGLRTSFSLKGQPR